MTTYILDAIGIAHVCDEAEVRTLCGSPVETIACEYVSSEDVEDLCPACAAVPAEPTLEEVAAATGGTVENLGGNLMGVIVRAWLPGAGDVTLVLAPADDAGLPREWIATAETQHGRLAWGSGQDDDFVRFALPADLGTTVATALAWLTVTACHRCHGHSDPGQPCTAWECRVCDGSPETGGCADNHSPVMCEPRFTVAS